MSLQFLEQYQDWVSSLPDFLQWLIIFLFAMAPYVELHIAAVFGMISGVNPVVSILLAIVGNFFAIFLCVVFAEKLNDNFNKKQKEFSPKRQKFNKFFDKYGVIGVSLLGWLILPSTVTSFLMVSVSKVEKSKVLLWMLVSLIVWGIVLGLLTTVFAHASFNATFSS